MGPSKTFFQIKFKGPTQTDWQNAANAMLSPDKVKQAGAGAIVVGLVAAAISGASDASVTLVVLNLGDQPLELAETPSDFHGYFAVQPAVIGGTKRLDPPNRLGGGAGPLTAWVNSPIQAGMDGYATVGVWRFNHQSSALFTNISCALRLTYKSIRYGCVAGRAMASAHRLLPQLAERVLRRARRQRQHDAADFL